MSIPILADEAQRLEALRALEILDTPAEKAFDDLAALAAVICQTKSATISLVEEYRQWFKSRVCLLRFRKLLVISPSARTPSRKATFLWYPKQSGRNRATLATVADSAPAFLE